MYEYELLFEEVENIVEEGVPTYYTRTPKEYMMRNLPKNEEELFALIVKDMKKDKSNDLHKYIEQHKEHIVWLVNQIPYLRKVIATYIVIVNEACNKDIKKVGKWRYTYLEEIIEYYQSLEKWILTIIEKNY